MSYQKRSRKSEGLAPPPNEDLKKTPSDVRPCMSPSVADDFVKERDAKLGGCTPRGRLHQAASLSSSSPRRLQGKSELRSPCGLKSKRSTKSSKTPSHDKVVKKEMATQHCRTPAPSPPTLTRNVKLTLSPNYKSRLMTLPKVASPSKGKGKAVRQLNFCNIPDGEQRDDGISSTESSVAKAPAPASSGVKLSDREVLIGTETPESGQQPIKDFLIRMDANTDPPSSKTDDRDAAKEVLAEPYLARDRPVEKEQSTDSTKEDKKSLDTNGMTPMSKTLSMRRFRRSFSDVYPCNYQALAKGRRASEIPSMTFNYSGEDVKRSGNTSVECLRVFNSDLKDQVARMRTKLESQAGHIKQAQWQKVVYIRQVRQQEQQRCAVALNDQRIRLEKEKGRELELQREQLTQKADSDLQKLTRFKDAEINKLKLEVESKDAMLQRLLGENRHARVKLNIDDRKSKLLDELKELRQAKKDLEESLNNAIFAERNFSNDLRKNSACFESEMAKVKREAQIENGQLIEQLKNKDKLISQLEKDLGHQWGAAQFAALERRRSEGSPLPPGGIAPSHPLRALPDGSESPDTLLWTPTSTSETEGVEDAWSKFLLEGNSMSKQDLLFKLKDSKDRTKELLEKCRSYLQQNKELAAQNRAFQESNERANHGFKKAQELLEHSKLQVLHLSRQLSHVKMEKSNLEQQALGLDRLREEIAEDKKMINALRQACSDKDRRIGLIQHRKKRRRVLGSAERQMIQSAGLRETYFGYEEDCKKAEPFDQSLGSSIASTISDEDAWDDELSREEIERNYQRLVQEHMELQKAHAMLQRQTGNMVDPQREHMDKTALQNDLFSAQCRIEHLEKLVSEIGVGEMKQLLMEREAIIEANRQFEEKARSLENSYRQLQKELTKAEERSEELEFRLMELEQCEDRDQNVPCEVSSTSHAHGVEDGLATTSTETPRTDGLWQEVRQEMEQLRQELTILLKGKGKEAEAVLKKLDQMKETERKMQGLEVMSRELQVKVIGLQQENNNLQDKLLMMEESTSGKGNHSSSLSAALERKENLELKATVESEGDVDERKHLLEELGAWKAKCQALTHQLDTMTQNHHTQHYQQQRKGLEHNEIEPDSSPIPKGQMPVLYYRSKDSNSPAPLVFEYNKKASHRKSKSRSGDDPTLSKRRRNSKDHGIQREKSKKFKNAQSQEDTPINADNKPVRKISRSSLDFSALVDTFDDGNEMKNRILFLEGEIMSLKKENNELLRQLREGIEEKNVNGENDQMMKDHVSSLERELDLLHKENVALSEQLRQRVEEFQYHRDDLNPRISELEEYCEDLQERLHRSETLERQLREKLKFIEGSIDEAENSELATREQYRQLLASDLEAKKQIQALQNTGQELKDIVLEKDYVEQALRDKVDFLQKAEAASVQRIEELEEIEAELREQLEQRSGGKSQNQKDAHKIQELKHQMTFLQKDNQALSARVAELEENEETLRENWRRVADEDFNRTQCLEEKVKMLESLNKELKSKLSDAQEYFVINTVPQLDTSLAAELADSQSGHQASSEDELDGAAVHRNKDTDGGKKGLKDKMRKLERQLSEVTEQKNTKIESLQEQLVSLKETEIKLSETISEMEMTERELKAKLALYESSEVTVEKMLKYQSKIEELRTSQESLLDQLENMESQEMSLQEKMQEMERTLRGKIVTLEVEMKRFKQKELKNAGRIRDLEKQETQLTTKVAQQAEKENNLYMKINSLMEELKPAKENLQKAREQLEEKEEKVRQAKLLEVKLLEIEMDYGKKTNELNTKLRHQEEEFRQKDAARENEIRTLQGEVAQKDNEEKEQRKNWEKDLAQKNCEAESAVSALQADLNKIVDERDELLSQVEGLNKTVDRLKNARTSLEEEIKSLREEVNSLTYLVNEKKDSIYNLSNQVENEKNRRQKAEEKAASLETQLAHEKQKVSETEEQLQNLKSEIESKVAGMNSFVAEKEEEHQSQLNSLEGEIQIKESRVKELEEELRCETEIVRRLQSEKDQISCEASQSKAVFTDGAFKLKNFSEDLLSQLDKEMHQKVDVMYAKLRSVQDNVTVLSGRMTDNQMKGAELEKEKASIGREWESKLAALKEEQSAKESELKNKVMFLDNQLQQEVMEKEMQQTSFQKVSHEKETALKSDVDNLQQELESHKRELISKLSELEIKNKEHCEVSLKLSQLRHSYKTLQKDFDQCKETAFDTENKLKSLLSERDEKLKLSNQSVQDLSDEVDQFKEIIKEKDNNLQKLSQDKDLIIKEKEDISQRESVEKSQKAHLEAQLEASAESLKEKNDVVSELTNLLSSRSSELEEIKMNLEHTEQELQMLTSECQLSESQHLFQLSEHQQTLDTYKEDTKQLQSLIEEKDFIIMDRDQTCKQIQLQLNNLSLHLKEREQELKQAESQVTDVNLKLKQMENKYRELESKCASLELTLEERYVVVQDAQKVLAKKEIQCQELEEQLDKTSKKLETLQEQVSAGNEDSKSLVHSLKTKEVELEQLHTEMCRLNKDLESNSKEFSTLETKCVELKQECTNLEEKCEKEKEKAYTTENCLLETEKECQTLQEKVLDCQNCISQMEEDHSMLKDQFLLIQSSNEDKEAKIQILNRSLEEYEAACHEKNARVNALEAQLSEGEKLNSHEQEQIEYLQEKLKQSCTEVQDLKTSLDDIKTEMNTESRDKENIKLQLETATTILDKTKQEEEDLNSELNHCKNEVQDLEKQLEESQKELASLEHKNTESRLTCGKLSSQLEIAESQSEERTKTLQQTQAELDGYKLKLEETTVDEKKSHVKWQETQQAYSDTILELNHLEETLNEREVEIISLKSQISELDQTLDQVTDDKDTLIKSNENLNLEIHNRENKMKTLMSDLETLSLSLSLQQDENKSFESTVKELEEDLATANDKHSELNSINQKLLIRLSDFEKQEHDLQPKLQDLELSLATLCQERDEARREFASMKTDRDALEDENQQLQKELDNASKEFDNLRVSCEESKTNIERKLHEMCEQKQQLEENFEKQTIALDTVNHKLAALENKEKEAKEVASDLEEVRIGLITMAAKCEQLEQDKALLMTETDTLQTQLKSFKESYDNEKGVASFPHQFDNVNQNLQQPCWKTTVSPTNQKPHRHTAGGQGGQGEEDIVSEECIQVSVAPSLQSRKSRRSITNSSKVEEDEILGGRVEKLTSEISTFTLRDDSYEQKIIDLEKSWEDAKEKERKMFKRVDELEAVEKELREQIIDIEMTVIVPLETENQELKDEIGMVRQERDEAISRVSSWDDEENGVDAVESAHQRLEESLVQVEELEKKNDILLGDISNLESERDSLIKALSEFEANLVDRDEKLEGLQEEVDRLLEVEKKVVLLEESESRLMDRVLDLEEHEQSLTLELETIAKEKVEFDMSENQSKHEDLVKKLGYLEEKNQLLQDAEGHYVDKVMELEEEVGRLRSELSFHKPITLANITLDDSPQSNRTTEEVSGANVNSLFVSTKSSVSLQSNITSGANVTDSIVNSLAENVSLLSLPQERSIDPSVDIVSLQEQLMEAEKNNNRIMSESQERDAKIAYLGDKLELLRDSEARLMEKLLESEEHTSNLKFEISKTRSDLNAKIEQLQEENEFLAVNVENYQKLYKEEKERSDDLQDRLMEDSSRLAELSRTQQELTNTQKMVQDMQCEYEEQLSERYNDEAELRKEFSSLETRHLEVEQELAAKCQRETELGLRIEALERSEKELKTRVESLVKAEEDESLLSDSGLSGDDPRSRHDATKYQESHLPTETPILKTSTASISFSPVRPPRYSKTEQSVQKSSSSQCRLALELEDTRDNYSILHPVGGLSRGGLGNNSPTSTTERRVEVLTSDLDLVNAQQRLKELEVRNLDLEARLRDAEVEKASLLAEASSIRPKQTRTPSVDLTSGGQFRHPQYFSSTTVGGSSDNGKDDENRAVGGRGEEEEEEGLIGNKELDHSFSSVLSYSSSSTMLEKPEDVLLHRIRELEGLEKDNKNQLSELERDREVLHEIARRDKASIHDLNVKIRELQLSERSLKEQVANLEVSENSLFSKCEELEVIRAQLDDRVHELEIHERRLRELVRKLKLDEERWLSKSGGFETAVAELSANEQQLKRLLQDVNMEKGGLSERAEYFQARIRELESVETTLLARIQNYETNEVGLQNRLVLLENSETANHSKASELGILNKDLTQRMKKVSDENAMMSQHLSQLHGQVQELDRRLLTSRDSELAFKQHVESLQKNESLLQKKVREYELRQIDSQSQIRELEQHLEINKDKIAALQRSENRLKYRVQELEGLGAPIPGELTPSQHQKIPQKLEDCQKRIVVLQSQVENLQLQLRQALNTTSRSEPAEESDDNNNNVTIATLEYSQLHAKAAMLDEIQYQNEELETVNEELNDTILQLRDGKGACGHEVEIEVLKRRTLSMKTFIEKLKSSLSAGQATSLLDPDQDSGPEGETLPARNLQVLESERVLQSVRGLNHDGKADTTSNGAGHLGSHMPVEETMTQTMATQKMAAPSTGSYELYNSSVKQEETASNSLEEPHWKAIEARKPPVVTDSRGGVKATGEGEARTTASSPRKQRSSSPEVEEVTLGLNLQSESELSSHYKAGQNDTDSSCSPIAPPRRTRAKRISKNFDQKASSGTESGAESPFTRTTATATAANQKHFDNDKSLPLVAHTTNTSSPRKGHDSQAPLSRFAEDSFYLPSSAQEGVDSLDDDEAPPLPSSGPPGIEGLESVLSERSSEASEPIPHERRDSTSADSFENSTSGMSIRDRIAMIEKNLRSDTQASSIGSREDEDQMLFWKKKSSDYARQVDSLDKEGKFLKDDINRLEKELEEKRRYINTLEVWLSSTEDLLKNKNKQTDREMVEQLQLELGKLRKELKQAGYRSEDALLDPAALKTELEHRDKEIVSKRIEIETLAHEVKRWHKECRNIEGMRRTALDSLRQLEREVLGLQNAEQKLEAAETKIHNLKTQYENKQLDLQSVIMEKEDVEYALKSVILERDGLKVELRRTEQERDELKPRLEEATRKVEDTSAAAAKSSVLQDQLDSVNKMLLQRTDKTREVYEENLNLRDRVNESEGELSRYRTLCDDFNNLSARYDEMEQFKNQALSMVQPLQLQVERLTNKCKEKDALLRRLGGELRRGLHRPSSALEELMRLERAMASEEYNMENAEEDRNGAMSPQPDHRIRARSVSMDELNFSHSDSDSVHSAASPNVTPTRRQRPTPYVNNRPRSAETVSSAFRGQRGVHARPRLNPRGQRSNVPPPKVYKGQFVAIADYDPGLFSQSGRPKLELLLREGDQVTVTGPMDRNGYCEAEVNGRTGLVPVIYLQAASQQEVVNGHVGQSSVIHLNPSVVAPGETYPYAQQDYGLDEREASLLPHMRASMEVQHTPDPPHHLHIRGVTGESLALAWLPPKLDQRGCSKGFPLMGYKVYVNNQEYKQVSDPQCCELVVKGLNMMYPVQLAVQSVCADGQVSPRTELVFEGMITMSDADAQLGVHQKDLDTDLSSVLNSVQYKRGHKKTVIALYDYNPEQQSPHDYTAFELAFHAGDVISVYGEPRPDGFFHGEIEGKRGLIPACFVEDLPSLRRPFKEGSHDVDFSSSKA